MCRLFAVIGKNIPIENLLQKFRILANDGKVPPGHEPGHHDGWGIGTLTDEGIALTKNHLSASTDIKYINAINDLPSNFSGILLAHLRKASKGSITSKNNHPFQRDNRLFMHNGTVYYPNLEGCDSLRYFLDLISLSGDEPIPNFKNFYNKLQNEGINYSSITSMYATSQSICILRSVAKTPEYYSVLYQIHPEYVIFSQEPLNEGVWKEIGLDEIVSVSFPSLDIQKNIL